MKSNTLRLLSTFVLAASSSGWLLSQTKGPRPAAASTTAIVLGVGSPNIDAERSGTSIGIIVAGTMYVVDAGDGVVHRIMEAAPKLAALKIEKLGAVFITHLDPDHTLGLAGLLTYHNFDAGRLVGTSDSGVPLNIYGPGPVRPPASDREGMGIKGVMAHVQGAFGQTPLAAGIAGSNLQFNPIVHATEIERGVIFQDSNVTVTAFKVDHKAAISFGFRIQTPDQVIVISGDTRPVDAVVDACNGCDLLFHEVFGLDFGGDPTAQCLATQERFYCNGQGHTSALELGRLAQRARPKHLVVYHSVRIPSEKEFLETIRKSYSGKVTLARDLDIF